MARRNYFISLDGFQLETKHAWNTARRAVPALIKAKLKDDETSAERSAATYSKGPTGREYTHGIERWTTNTGREITVTIVRGN